MIPDKKIKILIVDDDESIRALIQKVLVCRQRTVLTAEGGRKAVNLFRRERPDITILDLKMPDMSGLDVLKEIREMDPSATVIIFSGTVAEALEQKARELGASDFVAKGGPVLPLGHAVNSMG
jgi:DNA-binding response OmpR family regulator